LVAGRGGSGLARSRRSRLALLVFRVGTSPDDPHLVVPRIAQVFLGGRVDGARVFWVLVDPVLVEVAHAISVALPQAHKGGPGVIPLTR